MSMFSKVEMEARFNRIFALKCMLHLQTVKIELKYKRKKTRKQIKYPSIAVRSALPSIYSIILYC